MGKIGEHGVNLRRSEAIRDTLRHVASGDLECSAARLSSMMFRIQRHHILSGWFVFARAWRAARSGGYSGWIGPLSFQC